MSAAARRRRIAVATVSRSDWGHLLPVLREIRAAPDLELQLLVAGMHLAERFGNTAAEIEAGGWPVAARVEMLGAGDEPADIAAATGRGVSGFGAALAHLRPDLLLVLGDRFEMLSAAVAALPFALPVAHIHGGEVTEGAMDNQIRHAITKLAHLHFASAPEHHERIAAMGEERWRIHMVGGPGLDRLRDVTYLPRAAVASALGLRGDRRWVVVTFHPVTLEHADTGRHADALVAALEKLDADLIVTFPNADTAGRQIIERLEDLARRRTGVLVTKSLGEELYLSLLRHADAMVGNSSSGLIEAPSFALPVVNVGSRQRGRLRAANVIDAEPAADDILRAAERALDPAFRAGLRGLVNPYGDGHAAPRIVQVLREVPLDARLVEKRFADGGGA